MYKIKQIPEDFFVKEIPDYQLDQKGEYSYFLLKKRNYTTMNAISKIANKLKIPLKFIGFAGNKDKIAVTEQVISIKNLKVTDIAKLNIKDIKLEFVGNSNKPISLGDLKGNQFKIIVRNLPTKRTLTKSIERIPNYFGPQRFSKNNIEIGRYLVKKNFKKAIDLIDQRKVNEFLEDNPGNYIGAIRTLPLKLRKIYIHAYQSFLWNKTVEEYLKSAPYKNELIPIIGFGTELKNNKISEIIREIMQKENLNQRDFIIPQMPELSEEGNERYLFTNPKNLTIKIENDELNQDKYKAIVSFILPKASYATIIIDYLFQEL
ncbi:tRNA pseudouridine(13) synthase TruD [Candidatus Woesearchaeota archaeon]|nr:tRNA pseudouridine(13) synthase TruD [Candidatus Woesearchaeota archaeon]